MATSSQNSRKNIFDLVIREQIVSFSEFFKLTSLTQTTDTYLKNFDELVLKIPKFWKFEFRLVLWILISKGETSFQINAVFHDPNNPWKYECTGCKHRDTIDNL